MQRSKLITVILDRANKKQALNVTKRLRPSKKPRWGFSDEASALRARFVGYAAKPHTCADRSVFCLGGAEAKNGFQKPAARADCGFSTS